MKGTSDSIDLGNISFLHENFNEIFQRHKKVTGSLIAGFVVEIVPFEILSALNITPLILPQHLLTGGPVDWNNLPYDVLLCPEDCTSALQTLPRDKTKIIRSFSNPDLHGQASQPGISLMIDSIISDISGNNPPSVNKSTLSAVTDTYNHLRRVIRGISTLRMEKPGLLACSELQLVFETALCLPADSVIVQLTALLDEMNRATHIEEKPRPRGMVFGSFFLNPAVLDHIEEAGLLIVEDDLCVGRRNFDLSHNTESPNLYEEIIDAFSYKPLCPCSRSQKARYDLLYKLIGNYGIETVIMVDDPLCEPGRSHIEELRVRLMRAGVDPLIVTPENAARETERYIAAASL